MYKMFFTLLLTLLSCGKPFAADTTYHKPADEGLKALKQQVIKDILAAPVDEVSAMQLAGKMKADGSWQDIDYTDKTRGGWKVNDHLVRLQNMAVIYARKGSKWTGAPDLMRKIISGLNFWLKNDFICPNWWYPEIGVPKVLGPTMLLIEGKLTQAQKEAGLVILNRAKIGMTGQNKVWLSGNVIYRSLLTGDIALIKNAVGAIQEEVVISEGEGIQADYSYHQHGPQQQFGNYGSAYAGDMLKWAVIFQQTPFRFAPEKIAMLRNYLLQGMRWIIWNNKMDISACGRQLFPDAQVDKADNIKKIFSKMPLIDPALKSRYLTAMNSFNGNKHFWRSDMTVHRRGNFYTSVKMSSRRVGGAESCNDENIQGYHLGDGATYFYQSGEEYTGIFPFWDWKMIPGTTAYHDGMPLPVLPCSGYRLETDFAGGVSDGMNGIATLDYHRDSLRAQKSWFFFDDAVICLGAGINTDENKEVTTTINQSFLHGNVLVKQAADPMIIAAGQHDLQGVSWVCHDNWGYFFPDKADVALANRQQSGDWNKVLKRMPAKNMEANLFTLWFNHSAKPRAAHYAYYVFPAATAGNIDARASAIEVVSNTDRLQAVENAGKQLAGIVFIQPGEAHPKTFPTITADKPCVVMMAKQSAVLTIVLSDPTHLQDAVIIGIQGKKSCKTVNARYDAGSDMSFFTVVLPHGPEAGKSIGFVVE